VSSRTELFATLQAQAVEMGWQVEEPYDGEGQVEMMLTAPGASEQVVSGTMLQARKQLNELGGPENYPAVEEYDLPSEEQTTVMGKMVQAQVDLDVLPEEVRAMAEVLIQHSAEAEHEALLAKADATIEAIKDTRQMLVDLDVITPEIEAEWETVQAVAQAEDITVEEAVDQLAYEENDPEWAELLAEIAAEEAEEAGLGEPENEPLARYTALEAANLAEEAAAEDFVVFEEFDSEPAAGLEEAMGSVRDAEASEAERARDQRLETEALEPEYARTDDAAGEAREAELDESEAALDAAVVACEKQRDIWDTRLKRARDALRNVVEEGNGHVGVDGLHEDISPYGEAPFGPTLKELWRGEVARPEQFVTEAPMTDRRIIARKGDQVKVFCSDVEADVKAGMKEDGFAFFHTSKQRANELARNGNPKVTAQRAGRVVTTTVNGREVAPEGYRIRVAGNGLPVQFFKSVNEAAWEGFSLTLVEAGA